MPDATNNHIRLLDEAIDLRANSRLLFTKHRDCVDWLVITAVLDAVSTTWFMFAVGPEIETNYIVRQFTAWLGFGLGPLVAKTIQLVSLWALVLIVPRLARFLCLFVISINAFACLFNTTVVVVNLLEPS